MTVARMFVNMTLGKRKALGRKDTNTMKLCNPRTDSGYIRFAVSVVAAAAVDFNGDGSPNLAFGLVRQKNSWVDSGSGNLPSEW